MNVIFDMETGDPDDLVTLLLLLSNKNVQLRGVTCWQGSPAQIGFIKHILSLASLDIPLGGLNSVEPAQLSSYYRNLLGYWKHVKAEKTPTEVFKDVLTEYSDTHVLTGAPLTNLADFLEKEDINIKNVTTQGGYLGYLVPEPLEKFKGRKAIRTYNLSSDTDAFSKVNNSSKIEKLTYVTKDLCHGFVYTPEFHNSINFGESRVQQLLKKCLEAYAKVGKSKAMHDPLAMLYMLSPEVGEAKAIEMSFQIDNKGHALFSSAESDGNHYGLISYQKDKAWQMFKSLCE